MKNIFVGNLDFGTTEQDLRSLFERYGAVERVTIVTDRDTGRSRGFGFVEMSANSEADQAINALNGTDVNGRGINVNEARPKGEGGGGGRGGFGANKRPSGGGGGRGRIRRRRAVATRGANRAGSSWRFWAEFTKRRPAKAAFFVFHGCAQSKRQYAAERIPCDHQLFICRKLPTRAFWRQR